MNRKISVFLVIALLTATLGAFTSDSIPAGEEIIKQGKITQALEKRITDAKSEDEVIPVYIWLTGIDSDEVLAETERQFGISEEEAIQDVDLFSGIYLVPCTYLGYGTYTITISKYSGEYDLNEYL